MTGVQILEELKQEDYELWIRTSDSHLSEEQWTWLINNFKRIQTESLDGKYQYKNCWELPCKFCDSDLDTLICRCTGEEVSEFIKDCEQFELARTCIDCKYSETKIYETGEIDSVDYYCPYENEKLIYSDVSPYRTHYIDIPECPTGRFERKA